MGTSSATPGDKGELEIDADSLVAKVLGALPDPVLVCKAGGRIVLANAALHSLLGYDDGTLVGRKVGKILPESVWALDEDEAAEEDDDVSGSESDEPVPARRSDGVLVPVAVSLSSIPGIGRPLSVAVLRLLGDDPDGVAGAIAASPDPDPDVEQLRVQLGRTRDELHRVHTELVSARSEATRASAQATTAQRELSAVRTVLGEVRNGRDRSARDLADAREELDDARRQLEELRDQLARTPVAPLPAIADEPELYDPVTELPRRPLLHDNLDRLLAHAGRSGGVTGVLMVDIDRFGELDHSYGHEVTEELLSGVAARLVGAVGPDDVLARMRTDEFAVVHGSARDNVSEFIDLADTLSSALEQPFSIGGVELGVTTSIGISVGTPDSTTAEEMLREADVAVARARSSGGARVELFDQELRLQARRRLDQATALRRALDTEELLVLWQAAHPLRPAEGEAADAEPWAEALVRWQRPERGLVSAGNFIQLAEETGLIVPIGRFVLGTACRQLASWRQQEGHRPTRVAVNLSARELASDDLVDSVAAALDESGLEPGALILEITESGVASGTDAAVRRLEELHELGVGLAMDDFGTGDSSLGFLRRLPVTVLKVDRAFVGGLTTSRADHAIVRGIIEIGHSLGLTVVAEGIETTEQLEALVALGCDRGQGYLWSSPVPVAELDAQLDAHLGGAPSP